MKPTMSTLKAFIRRNRDRLQILCKSDFDAMTDCVRQTEEVAWRPIAATDRNEEHTLGIAGVWLVGRSRDYISAIDTEEMTGFSVSNSCGSFEIGIQKGGTK